MDKYKFIDNTEEKLNTIKNSFFFMLDDFKTYYILNKTYPNNIEYNNFYENSKTNLQNSSKQLMNVSKEIINALDVLNSDVVDISNKLDKQRELNTKMTDIYSKLHQSQNGSELFINDAKKLYNQQYYRNLHLLVGIIGLTGGIVYLSKSKT
jgi:DNA-binding transcriptional regulator GbsR (MarR family)